MRLDRSFAGRGSLMVPTGAEAGAEYPDGRLATALAPSGGLVAAGRGLILAFLPDGSPDPGFGSEGRVEMRTPPGSRFRAAAVAIDSNRRVLVGGTIRPSVPADSSTPAEQSPPAAALYRYLPSGDLDPGFGNRGVRHLPASVEVTSVGVDERDRPMLVGLLADCPNGSRRADSPHRTRAYLARLRPDGSPDASFGEAGVVRDEEIEASAEPAIGAAGRIAFCGRAQTGGPRGKDEEPRLVSLRDDGDLDRDFGEGGRLRLDHDFRAVRFDRHGRLLLLGFRGARAGPEGMPVLTVKRLLPSGSIDSSFGRSGSTQTKLPAEAEMSDLAIDGQGRILLAGTTPSWCGAGRSLLLIGLGPRGKPGPGFGVEGRATVNFGALSRVGPPRIAIDGGGGIVLGATLRSPRLESGYGFAFARHLSEGRWT